VNRLHCGANTYPANVAYWKVNRLENSAAWKQSLGFGKDFACERFRRLVGWQGMFHRIFCCLDNLTGLVHQVENF